jgi:hypothetical protein
MHSLTDRTLKDFKDLLSDISAGMKDLEVQFDRTAGRTSVPCVKVHADEKTPRYLNMS